jgi:hypothetical protein
MKFLPAGTTTPATAATTTAAAAATTSASTPTTSTPAAVSTTTASATAGRLGTRFVDIHGPAIQIRPIQFGNGCFRIATFSHFNESKTTGLTGFPIGYNVDAFYTAESRKGSIQVFLRSLVAEIPHENVRHGLNSFDEIGLCPTAETGLEWQGAAGGRHS